MTVNFTREEGREKDTKPQRGIGAPNGRYQRDRPHASREHAKVNFVFLGKNHKLACDTLLRNGHKNPWRGSQSKGPKRPNWPSGQHPREPISPGMGEKSPGQSREKGKFPNLKREPKKLKGGPS